MATLRLRGCRPSSQDVNRRIRQRARAHGCWKRIRRAVVDLIGVAVVWVPGRAGSELRGAYYRARGARIGKRVRLDVGVLIDGAPFVSIGDESWIDRFAILIGGSPRAGRKTRIVGGAGEPGRLVIGRRCHIGPHAILSGFGGLFIGDDVTASAGSKLYSLSHHYRSWSRPSMAPSSLDRWGQTTGRACSRARSASAVTSGWAWTSSCSRAPRSAPTASSAPGQRSSANGPDAILEGDPVRRSGSRFPDEPARADP